MQAIFIASGGNYYEAFLDVGNTWSETILSYDKSAGVVYSMAIGIIPYCVCRNGITLEEENLTFAIPISHVVMFLSASCVPI